MDPEAARRARASPGGGAQSRLGKLALLVASVLVALLGCEAALRVTGFGRRFETSADHVWPWIVYDPILNRKNVGGFVLDELGVRIDALGFRGAEVSPRKPAGTLRIACLGDSATFGVWLDGALASLRTSYPAELARLLAAQGYDHVEVINAGVFGHTTGEGLAQLLTQIVPLAPDVITVRYGNNDHLLQHTSHLPPAAYVWDYAAMRLLPAPAFGSELVRLAFLAYHQGLALGPPPVGRYRVPLDRFATNLRRFVRIGRANGVHVLFVDFPYRELERGDSPGHTFPDYFTEARSLAEFHAIHDDYQAVVARVADETGTPFLRTAEALRRSPTPAFTAFDLSHPNATGYAIVAERMLAELERLHWLTPSG